MIKKILKIYIKIIIAIVIIYMAWPTKTINAANVVGKTYIMDIMNEWDGYQGVGYYEGKDQEGDNPRKI